MEAQQAIPVVVHPAQVVGNAFVTQYYNVLHQSPQMAYRFYQDCSKLGRPSTNGDLITVTTMEGINQMIMSLDYSEFKPVIKTIDSQESHNNGVLVLVTGSLSFQVSGTRMFTQSFFLAPQDKGYFVLNDVLRYMDEEPEQTKKDVDLVKGLTDRESTVPLSEPAAVAEPETVTENGEVDESPSVEQETPAEEELHSTEQGQASEVSVVVSEAVTEQQTPPVKNEVRTAHEVPAVVHDVVKKSYASIVKVMSENTAPVVAVQKPPAVRAVTVSAERQANNSTPPKAPTTESSSPIPANGTDNSTSVDSEGNACSIYIRNLPYNATANQLEEEFKKFGAIKPLGVQVRSKQGGFCYGFVEFETAASVQTALEASPITIGGRQAFVEEKRPTSGARGSAARGRPIPVRGAFRNDGSRGRGGYSSRGNGRNEFTNRGDLGNRGRGNLSGRGGLTEDPEGFQRVEQFRNSVRGGRRGGMVTSNGPRMGSVAA